MSDLALAGSDWLPDHIEVQNLKGMILDAESEAATCREAVEKFYKQGKIFHSMVVPSVYRMHQVLNNQGVRKDLHKQSHVPFRSFEEWLAAAGLSKTTAYRWMRLYDENGDRRPELEAPEEDDNFVPNGTKLEATVEDAPEEEVPAPDQAEPDHDQGELGPTNQRTWRDYWDDFDWLRRRMRYIATMTKGRSAGVPVALSRFCDNLERVAERIDTWAPEALEACPQCNGLGRRTTPQGHEVGCDHCIDGRAGWSK